MKRFSSLFLVIPLLSALAQAQQPPPSGQSVTVVGCLQRAERSGSLGGTVLGTSATPNTAPVEANKSEPAPGYVLADARPAGSDERKSSSSEKPSASPAATGTAGVTASNERDRATTYGLSGSDDQFAQVVGHRVEVTGTVMDSPAKDRAFRAGTGILKVSGIRSVADTCSQ